MLQKLVRPFILSIAMLSHAQGICDPQDLLFPQDLFPQEEPLRNTRRFPAQFDVIATGLRNPGGFTITPKGIFIAQVGLTASPPPPPLAPFTHTGRISLLHHNGRLEVISNKLLGLQGAIGAEQENTGFASVAWLHGSLYALANFGPLGGGDIPSVPISGVYKVNLSTGALTLVANLFAFDTAHCPLVNPNCQCPPACPLFTAPFDMVAWRGKLYVTNGHTDTVDEVDPTKPLGSNVKRFADFSGLIPGEPHPVITGINVGPCGNFLYVVQLTPFASNPQPPNSARVWRISTDGTIKQVARGYNYGQGVAVDCDGSIYITQFAHKITQQGKYIGAGSLVRWNPETGVFETILPNLTLPGPIRIRGNYLYIINHSQLGRFGDGQLIRINLNKYRLSDCSDSCSN